MVFRFFAIIFGIVFLAGVEKASAMSDGYSDEIAAITDEISEYSSPEDFLDNAVVISREEYEDLLICAEEVQAAENTEGLDSDAGIDGIEGDEVVSKTDAQLKTEAEEAAAKIREERASGTAVEDEEKLVANAEPAGKTEEKPAPKPTATAKPESKATPNPTATAKPESKATPNPTATPKPELKATPKPTATAKPESKATPKPTATSEPVATVEPTLEPLGSAVEPEGTTPATEPTGKVEVSRVYVEDCGMDTGYWVVTYSDGTVEYIDD